MQTRSPSLLSDAELVTEVQRLARVEREATAQLVAHLAELDARRLYLGAGFPSLFTYCTEVLRLAEHATYNRIEAARAARRFPVVLELLGKGSLNLTSVRLLAPHLTDDNHRELLAAASGKSKREVAELLARYFPRPAVRDSIRRLPARSQPAPPVGPTPWGAPGAPSSSAFPASPDEPSPRGSIHDCAPNDAPGCPGAPHPLLDSGRGPTPGGPGTADPRRAGATPGARHRQEVTPLAPDRFEIRFTASARTCEKLRLAKDLLRHSVPTGDTAEIVDRALAALLRDVARGKVAATDRPRESRGTAAGSRHVPAEVKRAVWLRDGGRCAFVAGNGHRCAERGFLEFHHVEPYAVGGRPVVDNIALRCRAHNRHEADLFYGPGTLGSDGSLRRAVGPAPPSPP